MPCVSVGGLWQTDSPSQYPPTGWIAPLLSLVPIPTGSFSVISPQTAGVWKSGTASRAAGVGARDSGLGGGKCGVWSLHDWLLGLDISSGLKGSKSRRTRSVVHLLDPHKLQ